MAYQRFNQGDQNWIVDKIEDLKTLPPCSMGSTCYVIETASKYMVNSKGEWICQTTPPATGGPVIKPDEPSTEPGISEEEIAEKYVSKEDYELEKLKNIKYEVLGLPEGTLVDYREKEIRVLIPSDTDFKEQPVGENGNPNMWYFQFRAYAPEDAYCFKEDDLEDIEDETLYYFTDKFAGIDNYGRKYSQGWFAAAYKSGGEWIYFGDKSSEEHMVGFFYAVEWYDKDQKLIGMDKIRINLTNKECHSMVEPYYIYDLKTAAWGELEE